MVETNFAFQMRCESHQWTPLVCIRLIVISPRVRDQMQRHENSEQEDFPFRVYSDLPLASCIILTSTRTTGSPGKKTCFPIHSIQSLLLQILIWWLTRLCIFHPLGNSLGPASISKWNSVFYHPFFSWWKGKIIE